MKKEIYNNNKCKWTNETFGAASAAGVHPFTPTHANPIRAVKDDKYKNNNNKKMYKPLQRIKAMEQFVAAIIRTE